MPRYQVTLDLSGMWETVLEAETMEEAVGRALIDFETDYDSVVNAIEPRHPTEDDFEAIELS